MLQNYMEEQAKDSMPKNEMKNENLKLYRRLRLSLGRSGMKGTDIEHSSFSRSRSARSRSRSRRSSFGGLRRSCWNCIWFDFATSLPHVSILTLSLLLVEDPMNDTDRKEDREESEGDPSERKESTPSRTETETESTTTTPTVQIMVGG